MSTIERDDRGRGDSLQGGVFIDAYNQAIRDGISGTIKTNVDTCNLVFVTIEEDGEGNS